MTIGKKPICCLDTSVIQGKFSYIINNYSKEEWMWANTETTDLELNDYIDKNNQEIFHKQQAYGRILDNKIKMLLQPGQIIDFEIEKVSHRSIYAEFPFEDESTQERRFDLARNSAARITYMEERIQKQSIEENDIWDNLKVKNYNNISFDDVENNVFEEINQIRQYDIRLDKFVRTYGLQRIKSDCPALYNTLLYSSFHSLLRKPNDVCNKFKISLNGKTVHINKSTITDIKISAAILPYIRKFVTSDISLCYLLRFLYFNYEDNVDLCR